MTLHIFNPEHDIALAANLSNFTAPHAGRQLRHDMGFLPVLWATEGDVVLVDDVEVAEKGLQRMCHACKRVLGRSLHTSRVSLAVSSDVAVIRQTTAVDAWGQDRALCSRLKRCGVDGSILPTPTQLDAIRLLSHRRSSAMLLPLLRGDGTIGESFECTSASEVERLIGRYDKVVLKAPWSSSGRGLRFCDQSLSQHQKVTVNLQGWLQRILQTQGSVMVEPYYNKVKDFGMEFTVLPDGRIRYEGLSLFHTANGAYMGNILATEAGKRMMMSRYVSLTLLDDIQERICRLFPPLLKGQYTGPFGIDMMICTALDDHTPMADAPSGFLLHPCVEINLRRTMGHAALALSPSDDDVMGVMRIDYANNNYQLKIERL